MSDIPEEEWKSCLTSILEELDTPQYNKMLEYLPKIPKRQRNGRFREKMPQKIIEHYGVEGSISAISDAMDKIPRKDPRIQDPLRPFVDKLRNKHENNSKGKKRKRDQLEEEGRPAADQKKSCHTDKERNTPLWKKSICDLKSSSEVLDTDVIAGKVVQKSGLRTYQTKEQEKKFFFYLAVVDETASIKVMVYGKMRYSQIKEGKFYLFRKLIRDDNGVKVTAQSKVSDTNSVEIPEKLEMEARTLIHSERPVCSISEAKSSDDKTEVSVEGTVTEIDPIEQVKVQSKERKKRQSFKLKDDTDSITICMWGEETKQSKGLSVGDVIKVTNMKINKYYETVSLNSTGFTQIHKVQSTGIQNVSFEIVGIIKATKKETHLEACFNQHVHTFVVASPLLAKAFGFKLEGDYKELFLSELPFSADAVIKGNKIEKIKAA